MTQIPSLSCDKHAIAKLQFKGRANVEAPRGLRVKDTSAPPLKFNGPSPSSDQDLFAATGGGASFTKRLLWNRWVANSAIKGDNNVQSVSLIRAEGGKIIISTVQCILDIWSTVLSKEN